MGAFGALSHGLSTGCLRFVPPSLATTQDSFPGGGQLFPGGIPVYPLSSVGKFRPFGFPFPWASLGAIYVLPMYWLCTGYGPQAGRGEITDCLCKPV
jgi:hypothetical protein